MGREGAVFGPQRFQHFRSRVTQAGAAAPALGTVGLNTLNDGTPTLARTSAGIYTVTLTGAFVANKTFADCRGSGAAARIFHVVYTSANVITINVFDAATPSAADSGDFDLSIDIVNP